ncbi:MAG TPA: hypothetical protein VMU87_05925 [Stellaceae bacterium]|nr:hypothetical protein [Stellaceae bacterium]
MTAAAVAAPQAASHPPSAWRSPSGFGFRDLLDIVNPLQHLPIISSIYRWVTGDQPGEAAQIAGDALYGGPIGVAFGLIDAATEDKAGHDLGQQALTALFGHHDQGTQVAAAAAPAGAAVPAPQATEAGSAPTMTAANASRAATAAAPASSRAPIPLFGGIALTNADAAGPPVAAAVPDHKPLPLPGFAQPQHATAATQPPTAAQEFLARNAALERQINNGSHVNLQTKPVPLELPPGTLLPQRLVMPAPTAPAAAPAPASPPAPAPGQGAPLDFSQKMLDALDKYMKLEKEREKAAPAPAVDLSL